MNQKKILNAVTKLHNNAKDGKCKINDNVYTLTFNRYYGQYDVTGEGIEYLRYNTRKITQAKQWLKEYLSN